METIENYQQLKDLLNEKNLLFYNGECYYNIGRLMDAILDNYSDHVFLKRDFCSHVATVSSSAEIIITDLSETELTDLCREIEYFIIEIYKVKENVNLVELMKNALVDKLQLEKKVEHPDFTVTKYDISKVVSFQNKNVKEFKLESLMENYGNNKD